MKKVLILLLTLAMTISTQASVVAQWKCNDNAADAVVADAIASYTGTFYDEDTPATRTDNHTTTGKINGALDFDGTNDYITVADDDAFTFISEPFSVAAWISLGVQGAAEFEILGKFMTGQMEWAFYLSGDALYFVLWDNVNGGNSGRKDTADYSLYESSGSYLFVVGTYDGSGSGTGIKIYLDGTQCDDSAEANGSYTAVVNTTSDAYIGMRHDSANKAVGQIDNLMVFDTALTQTEITTLYNDGVGTESTSFSVSADNRVRYSNGYRSTYRNRYRF